MPNRLLKESICSSENIDKLTTFQEIFFYRLIVNCDDYGRMDARPKILASKLFPLKDIKLNHIKDALRALSSAELVSIYEVDGKPFLQMRTWERHQQIRAHKSKYPSPDAGTMITDDITCNQMISDDIKCPRNPIQSNPIRNPIRTRNPMEEATEECDHFTELFDRFWNAYPRKESKPVARKAFEKIKPDDALVEKMIESINKWKQSSQWTENGGRFIPYPASWLNQQKWNDEPPVAAPANQPQKKILPAQDFSQRDYSHVQEDDIARLNQELYAAREKGII